MTAVAVRLAIYCQNRLFSEGLQKILEDEPGFEIAGAFNGDKSFREMMDMRVDVILSDLDSFSDYEADVLPFAKKKILLLCNTVKCRFLQRELSEIISRGVVGILPYDTNSILLKKAIRTVCSGELWINHKTMKAILDGEKKRKKIDLTNQEMNIGRFICRGLRNKEIARELDISEQTVKSHCNRIFKKLGVSDRLQLALLLVDEGLGPK